MNIWQISLVFSSGLASGSVLFPAARMIESKGLDSFLYSLVHMVTRPIFATINMFRGRRPKGPVSLEHCIQREIHKVDPREQKLDETTQSIRGMLLSLAAAIQRTDKATDASTHTLDDIRSTLDRMVLPGELKDSHFLLLGEIDQMIASNNSLKTELSSSQEVLSTQREQIERLKTAVRIDSMTQLANRAFFEEKLSEMVQLFERYGDTFSLLIIDVDRFKSINDTFGHHGGDRVLRGVGAKIRSSLRHTDFVARIGGDEFAVILMKASGRSAGEVARKLCGEIEDSRFILDGNEIRVTLSVGVAEVAAGDSEESLLKRADVALYQVKQTGRNGVHVAALTNQNCP